MPVAAILGSAFGVDALPFESLEPRELSTPFGPWTMYRVGDGADRWVSFRHGLPHQLLPNQIPYRAQAWALAEVGCEALLVTSSVGVLDRSLPLDAPLLVEDLLMLDNRLPDGSACTMFPEPVNPQWHLVLDEGLISTALTEQVEAAVAAEGAPAPPRVVFGYAQGPRTKTAAENVMFSRLGAQVDSMTLAPEVVLANELRIPTAALVMGHKYSVAGVRERLTREATDEALAVGASFMGAAARRFLAEVEPVDFGNRTYQY